MSYTQKYEKKRQKSSFTQNAIYSKHMKVSVPKLDTTTSKLVQKVC